MRNKYLFPLKYKVSLINIIIQAIISIILIVLINRLGSATLTSMRKESTRAIIVGQARQIVSTFRQTSNQVQELAKHEVLEIYLANPTIKSKHEVEIIFQSFMIGTGYSNVYAIDNQGDVIASVDPSFVGKNFAYRDYFTKAMDGKVHTQIALGTLTKVPGYYYSAPIVVDGEVQGVIVIKQDTALIDAMFDDSPTKQIGHYFLTDEYGVVVSTDKEIDLYSTLGNLSEEARLQLTQEQRYVGLALSPMKYQSVQEIVKNGEGSATLEFVDENFSGRKVDTEKELLQVEKIGDYPFYLVTETSLESTLSYIQSIIMPVAGLLGGSAILGLILQFMIYQGMFLPLTKLEQYTTKVARGEIVEPMELVTNDELSILAQSLSLMVRQITNAKDELERAVQLKTLELSRKLKELASTNEKMSNNEAAMLNILEDSKELEKQLAIEKESVERKVDERTRELSDEQARLMASISALPRAFIILDKDSNILIHNNKLNDIFGKQDSEWNLDLIGELLGVKIDLQDLLKKLQRDGENIDISDILYKAKYLRVFAARVINKSGELLGAVMTIKDESEAKALARSRDEFFSIASHELRTPLTAIRGNTSMIMDYYKEVLKDKELKEMIEDTHTAAIRLIAIVNDFLDLSRLEQGRMEYKSEQVDLVKIVEKVVKDLTESANEKGIKLQLEGEPSLKTKLDPDKFEQIMLNLMGNSLKFTNEGMITVKIEKNVNEIRIEVKDTGEGIAMENRNLLFRKFQQAGTSMITRDGSKGTGLGLYISRLMVEGMGGTIELLTSTIGKGSIFGITLPITNEK